MVWIMAETTVQAFTAASIGIAENIPDITLPEPSLTLYTKQERSLGRLRDSDGMCGWNEFYLGAGGAASGG